MPALYLPNGTINAAEDQLDSASLACEFLALCFGALVIGSVIAEFVIAHADPPYAVFLLESSYTDAGVAIGIVGEVWFGMRNSHIQNELRRRSNEKVRLATERAARAEEQLAPRDLSKEQFDELQTLRGKVPRVILTTPSDFESSRYATQIGLALMHAGMDVSVAPQRLGLIWTELYIVIPEPVPDFRSVPLYATFSKAGFPVGCGDRSQTPMGDLPKDTPIIMVGVKKPALGEIPPFMAGLANPMHNSAATTTD